MASLARGGVSTEFEKYGERGRSYVLEWKDGEVRQQEFGTPGGVDWSDLRSLVRSTLPPAAVKQSKMNFFCLSSFLALGWLYQVWYDSLTTPVELHLRKTIRRTTASVPTRPESS